MKRTTITLSETTKSRLVKLGKFGQSYDQLISQMLKKLEDDAL